MYPGTRTRTEAGMAPKSSSTYVLVGRSFGCVRPGPVTITRDQRIDYLTLLGQPALSQPGRPWGNRRRQVGNDPQTGQYVIGSHRGGHLPYD